MDGRNVLTDRLSDLLYIADRAAAEYIIEVQRMKTARKRTQMYQSRELHMCLHEGLYEGCENPVVGKAIFAHCEIHLDDTEKKWLEEDVETHGFSRREERPLSKAFETLEIDHIKESQQKKEIALNEAFKIVKEFWKMFKERRRYLPKDLLSRLEKYESSLLDPDTD
jgi:hypothetical protein